MALGVNGIAYVPRCLVYQDFINGDLIDISPDQIGNKLGIYAVLIEHIKESYSLMAESF